MMNFNRTFRTVNEAREFAARRPEIEPVAERFKQTVGPASIEAIHQARDILARLAADAAES